MTEQWTLQPPTVPGVYRYREHQYEPVQTFTVVDVEGELMAELPGMWMYLRELDGEWLWPRRKVFGMIGAKEGG